jgi:hypothetical protein
VIREPQDVALITATLKPVQVLLGPLGHADQKLGLSVPLLRIRIDHIGGCVSVAPSWVMKLLFLRDLSWLLVSFFGFCEEAKLPPFCLLT